MSLRPRRRAAARPLVRRGLALVAAASVLGTIATVAYSRPAAGRPRAPSGILSTGGSGDVSGQSFHLDGSPPLTATMTFRLPAGRTGLRAVLHVYADSPSKTGYVVSSGAASDRSSPFGRNTWTSVDVTNLLGAGPTLTLTLSDPGPTAIRFAGAAGHDPPELLLVDGTGAVRSRTSPGGAPAPVASGGAAEQGRLAGGKVATIAAAGDIACDPTSPAFGHPNQSQCAETATSDLMLAIRHLTAVLPLGDDQYECGRASAFATSYAPSWGRLKSITHPIPGNHEYGQPCHVNDATPYFQYFGRAAGPFGTGWYSYDLADWHLIALNSECSYGPRTATAVGGCGPGSPQELWLRRDLRAHRNVCTLAYWHEPRFSSGEHGDAASMSTIWNDLVAAHVDVVLSGHNHDYERFAPIGATPAPPASAASTTTDTPIYQQPNLSPSGITEFVAGTGGKNHYAFSPSKSTVTNPPLAGEQFRNATDFGVLELTLLPRSFQWQFLTTRHTILDRGSAGCH